MENLPAIDTEIWENCLEDSNKQLSPSENDWASWKCGGGPHRSSENNDISGASSRLTMKYGSSPVKGTIDIDLTE